MPKSVRTLRLRRLQGRLGEVAYQITRTHFAEFRHPAWQPAANAYRCQDGIRICLDLAGVSPQSVELEVGPDRLTIRGRRDLPEPNGFGAMQVLHMEIDHGEFEREIRLPLLVEPTQTRLETRDGLLWIHLPGRAHA